MYDLYKHFFVTIWFKALYIYYLQKLRNLNSYINIKVLYWQVGNQSTRTRFILKLNTRLMNADDRKNFIIYNNVDWSVLLECMNINY